MPDYFFWLNALKLVESQQSNSGSIPVNNQTQKPSMYEKVGLVTIKGQVALSEVQPKHWLRFTQALSVLLIVLGAFSVLFFTVAHRSLNHIYLGTIPIRADASTASIEKQVRTASATYRIAIRYPDGSIKKYPISTSGITVDAHKTALNAQKTISNSFINRVEWWRPLTLTLYTKSDPRTITAFIANHATVVKTPSVDATLVVNGGVATVTPESSGKGSGLSDPEKGLKSAVASLNSQPLVLKSKILKPSITAKELESSKTKVQAILAKSVVFTIAGHTVAATPADIGNWLDLSPVTFAKTVDVSVDSGKVQQYIDLVARRYITPPRSRLVTNTSEGQIILDYGADGVDVVAKEQTAASVAATLTKDESVNVALNVQYTPAKTVESPAYPKWFVADTTTKRMYAYEGTTLVRAFLISAGAPATPTVTGTYNIYAKYVSQDMTGNNADGSRYFQPAVPYVNYFTGGYAIHGNYWRPASWFGNVNSSHGCLGVTVDDGAWIYNWAPIGTPVIVHR